MSKKQIKQSTQLTDIEVPPEIALSLLKPDELEKLEPKKRYCSGAYSYAYARENDVFPATLPVRLSMTLISRRYPKAPR